MAKIAYAVIEETGASPKILSSSSISTVSKESVEGIYNVSFEQSFFSSLPSVTLTQIYNGKSQPVSCSGYEGGSTLDNAVVICVEKGFCRIKTGDGSGNGTWRSFSIQAIGD